MLDALDRKLIDNFPGLIVRKDLANIMKKGANVPVYVLEYLLGQQCSSEDEDVIKIGMEKINNILSNNYVNPEESEYIKSKIREIGEYTIIDKVSVRFDEKEDKYIVSFHNFMISPFEIPSELVIKNDKLLIGGIWCIIKIKYSRNEEDDDINYNFEDNDELDLTIESIYMNKKNKS